MADELKRAIKEWARQLGFSLAGVTTPDPPPHLDVFERWLAEGRHGEMEYLARDRGRLRRADPRSILPECESVVVLAAPHPGPATADGGAVPAASEASAGSQDPTPASPANRIVSSTTTDEPARGRIAAYAWGRDYHDVLQERMKELVRLIEARVGRPIPSRCYADTGPILEREFAQRAGLGWIGKNTCLINPRAGSYFLLCELLLGIQLEPDAPMATDHCGTCTRCLDACPTSCILPDRTIDARRCISYLTIELRAEIPTELRPLMGNWIFGCDICQLVCPWNRFAPHVDGGPFAPHDGIQHPVLTQEVSLGAAEFKAKYGKTPISRARRSGYVRNTAVALGNVGRRSDLSTLEGMLDDSETIVREHVTWAIAQIQRREQGETPPSQ